jgi:hypothetical protein
MTQIKSKRLQHRRGFFDLGLLLCPLSTDDGRATFLLFAIAASFLLNVVLPPPQTSSTMLNPPTDGMLVCARLATEVMLQQAVISQLLSD